MNKYVQELFLKTYFLFECIVGRFCDTELLFNRLASIFMLGDAEYERLFGLVHSEAVAGVIGLSECNKFLRMRQYAELCEVDFDYTDEEINAIALKGETLKAARDIEFLQSPNATQAEVQKNLDECAQKGFVKANLLLGVLQLEGVFAPNDSVKGIKNISKAARWNSLEGLLAQLYYCGNKQYTLNCIKTLVANSHYNEFVTTAESTYGITAGGDVSEVKLLEKAFAGENIKRQKCSSVISHIVYSPIISAVDKKRVLQSYNQEMLDGLGGLPLSLKFKAVDFQTESISFLGEACNRIHQNLVNSDLRNMDNYKTLCLSFDSSILLKTAQAAMQSVFPNANVVTLNVADLTPGELESTNNNILLRHCDNNRNNVYLFVVSGDVDERITNYIAQFMCNCKRSKFHITSPNVCLDLSAILPICLCERRHGANFRDCCEVVPVLQSATDKGKVVQMLFAEKENIYSTKISAEHDVMQRLENIDAERIDAMLEKFCKTHRQEIAILSVEDLAEANNDSTVKYGFGGNSK